MRRSGERRSDLQVLPCTWSICTLPRSLNQGPCRRSSSCRSLAATEARLAAAATRLQEAEAAAAAQHVQLDGMAQHLAGVEAEHAALREEYRAVTDDLAALVKENQVGCRTAAESLVALGSRISCCASQGGTAPARDAWV